MNDLDIIPDLDPELMRLIRRYNSISNIPNDALIEKGYIRHRKRVKGQDGTKRETIVVVSMDTLSEKQIAKAYKDSGIEVQDEAEKGLTEEQSLDSLIETAQARVEAGFSQGIGMYLSMQQRKALVDGVYDWVSTVYSTVEEKVDVSKEGGTKDRRDRKGQQDEKKPTLTSEGVPNVQFVEQGSAYLRKNPMNVTHGSKIIGYVLREFLDGFMPGEKRSFEEYFKRGEETYFREKREKKEGRKARRALEELSEAM